VESRSRLGHAGLMRLEEESVHVGDLDGVVIV